MNYTLKFVRKDSEYVVFTEHPDHIHPWVLSKALLDNYGKDHFEISLRRNIYVIYVDSQVVGDRFVSETIQSPEGCMSNREKQDLNPAAEVLDSRADLTSRRPEAKDSQQKLRDIKLAENVLREARLSKSQG